MLLPGSLLGLTAMAAGVVPHLSVEGAGGDVCEKILNHRSTQRHWLSAGQELGPQDWVATTHVCT